VSLWPVIGILLGALATRLVVGRRSGGTLKTLDEIVYEGELNRWMCARRPREVFEHDYARLLDDGI